MAAVGVYGQRGCALLDGDGLKNINEVGMGIPRGCHRGALKVTWGPSGALEVGWDALGVLWRCHGGIIGVPLVCHGGLGGHGGASRGFWRIHAVETK